MYSQLIYLQIVAFIVVTALSDHTKWCYNQCLANSVSQTTSSNSIDIYLEYKRAVIKVPSPQPKSKINTFVMADGRSISDELMRSVKVDPVEAKCSSSSAKVAKKKLKCRPRPFVLEVVSDVGKVIPNKVLTRQCSGYCTENRICTSITSKNISASVQIVQDDGTTSCSTILVPQDVKCQCRCATTQENCNSIQEFDKKECLCRCTNKQEESHCKRKIEHYSLSNHVWDPKTCSCLCRDVGECTTGTEWDKTRCRCVKRKDYG